MSAPVFAQEVPAALLEPDVARPSDDRNVFVFGGIYSSESIGETLNIVGTDYQNAFMLGAGYQQFFLGEEGGWRLGGEYGLALRNGPNPSAEVWAGFVVRSDGFIQTDDIKISASVTGGLSAITSPLGVEVNREISRDGGHSGFLFYMAPELSISTKSNPNMEVFWRLQHRSGGWETLGGMGEGSNANTLGIRWSF